MRLRHVQTEERPRPRRPRRARGFTIIEVLVVLTMVSIMIAMAIPSFQRSIELLKADVAVANLRAVWSAERFYWMDNRAYTSDLNQLRSLDLIDPALTSGVGPYDYSVEVTAGGGFVATATRTGSNHWLGSYSIDQSGVVTGSVQALGEPEILPSPH